MTVPSPQPQPASPQAPLKKAEHYAAVRDWPGYFAAVAGKPARETLTAALDAFAKEPATGPRLAIDLGCGEGRDTVELLRRGWRVLAIDGHPMALDLLSARADLTGRDRLEMRLAGFEGIELPGVDLVNSSYSLPFCPPEAFEALWASINRAVRPGGRFAGQFFGERDTWAALPDRAHHTRSQVDRLLAGFVIESLKEVEEDGNDAGGTPKHWHVFHVVARKRR